MKNYKVVQKTIIDGRLIRLNINGTETQYKKCSEKDVINDYLAAMLYSDEDKPQYLQKDVPIITVYPDKITIIKEGIDITIYTTNPETVDWVNKFKTPSEFIVYRK
jgi:hypothetical protein